MQIAVGGGQGDFLGNEAADHGGDGRRFRVPHVGVTDQHRVAGQFLCRCVEEGNQRARAALLFAFEQEADGNRQLAAHFRPGPAGLDEGHQRAFVVRGATRHDMGVTVRGRFQNRFERVGLPQVERIDGLYVVVAVKQHVWTLARQMADDHRMPDRLARRRFRAEGPEIGGKPFGSTLAVFGTVGIGGNRGDADQVEKPVEPRVDGLVDMGENVVSAHAFFRSISFMRALKSAAT